jgi:hypothetical protein
MKTELISMYSEGDDVTFVVKRNTDAAGNLISQEVTGFYHGKPTAAATEIYNGKPKATYEVYAEPAPEILKAESMLQHMTYELGKTVTDNNEKLLERFYDLKIIIGFGDKVVTFDNCAAIYNALTECLTEFIANY